MISDRAARRALRLISRYGREVTVVKRNRDPSDPNRPYWGPGTDAEPITVPNVKAWFAAAGMGFRWEDRPDDQRNAEMGCYIAARNLDHNLETFDEVHDGDDVWAIEGGQLLKPGSTRVLYQLGVRSKR